MSKEVFGSAVAMREEARVMLADRMFGKVGAMLSSQPVGSLSSNDRLRLCAGVTLLGLENVGEVRQFFVEERDDLNGFVEANIVVEISPVIEETSLLVEVAKYKARFREELHNLVDLREDSSAGILKMGRIGMSMVRIMRTVEIMEIIGHLAAAVKDLEVTRMMTTMRVIGTANMGKFSSCQILPP